MAKGPNLLLGFISMCHWNKFGKIEKSVGPEQSETEIELIQNLKCKLWWNVLGSP